MMQVIRPLQIGQYIIQPIIIIKESHSLNLPLPMQLTEMVHSITSIKNIAYQNEIIKQ
jgi:hypothetical protein